MTLRVSGKNLDIGESLRNHVGSRIDDVVAKYAERATSGHVTVEREGSGFRTDCTLHLTSGISVQAEAAAQDAYESFNKAADRMERRLQRLRRRVRARPSPVAPRRVSPASAATTAPLSPADSHATAADATAPLVISETIADLRTMSVSHAVAELDTQEAPLLVFRHARDGHTHIVYRRRDGHIGWIDTSTGDTSAGDISVGAHQARA